MNGFPEFQPWPKIPRLSREIVITEKIDGTNAQVSVLDDGRVIAGSRTRWITPQDDNFGFAKWVLAHEDELREGLGVGSHFGEWWGSGIQRNYGMDKKVFSLFNTFRWGSGNKPECCEVVPILFKGMFDSASINSALEVLRLTGSVASPGFKKPEGIVIYHHASGQMFKKTLEKDDVPKGSKEIA